MTRLAVIGFGGYGWNLVRFVRELGGELGCRIVAAADARLDEFADKADELRQGGAEVFGDAMEMLRACKGRCDAVMIATSIHSHLPLMLAALKEGYHVHLEKPPAATVQEVDRMIAALRDSGRMCLVGFQAQHSADLRFVKERVVSGRLGDVLSASCHAGWPRGRSYYSRNEWAGKLRRGDAWVLDGPAINALAHQTMNLLYLVSRRGGAAVPTAARGEMYAAGPVESHNIASFELRTDAGANCYVSLAHCTQGAWHPTIDVDCSLGRVSWQMSRGATITYKDGTSESCPADSGQIAMVRNFVEALEADDPSRLRVDLPMARNMVLALDGAHESSRRVHRVPDQYVRTVDDDPRAVVDGLDEMLKTAAERRCLLSDLSGAPPWTVRTDWFDLRDYSRFPVQFEP